MRSNDNSGRSNSSRTGSEDTTEARRHLENVAENTRASTESARRVEASVPAEIRNTPVQAANVGTAGQGGEDNTQAVRNMQEVRENTEANREQARRVEATTPPDIRTRSNT